MSHDNHKRVIICFTWHINIFYMLCPYLIYCDAYCEDLYLKYKLLSYMLHRQKSQPWKRLVIWALQFRLISAFFQGFSLDLDSSLGLSHCPAIILFLIFAPLLFYILYFIPFGHIHTRLQYYVEHNENNEHNCYGYYIYSIYYLLHPSYMSPLL